MKHEGKNNAEKYQKNKIKINEIKNGKQRMKKGDTKRSANLIRTHDEEFRVRVANHFTTDT